jgi:hypothetical protein
MLPALRVPPAAAATDHVTDWLGLFVPETTAANCTCVPIIAALGETVIELIVGPVGTEGGGVVIDPPPPPHAVVSKPRVNPTKAVTFVRRKLKKDRSINSNLTVPSVDCLAHTTSASQIDSLQCRSAQRAFDVAGNFASNDTRAA